jgi:KipI family sensor histidine kinase inhibitor
VTGARPAGDAALLVAAGELAGPLAAALRSLRLPGVLDAIAGARTVLVITEPGRWDLGELEQRVAAVGASAAPWPASRAVITIPVVYDGPDLAEVAQLAGLSPGEVIERHAAGQYTVGWLGFSPGFPYLTGLDPALDVPRRPTPRTAVPAGSVAIAGGLAAVYPSASPGGWRLLGRTSARLWDSHRNPPALLAPGTQVRFEPVAELPPSPVSPAASRDASAASPKTPWDVTDAPAATATPTAGAPTKPPHDRGDFSGDTPEKSPRSWNPTAIEVVRPGPLATVQDLGRPGFGHLGVPAGGAADAGSLMRANDLVGNPAGTAGLEFTLGRAVLRFGCDAVVAVTGAAAEVTVDTGTVGTSAGYGVALRVPAGAVLRIGAPPAGLRTYLAVRGGIDTPLELGSRSADLLSGLGPKPLRAGDVLPIGPSGTGTPPGASSPPGASRRHRAANAGPAGQPAGPATGGAVLLTVVPGPRDDWFTEAAMGLLCGADYTVRPASDRTGLRLDGPALPRAIEGELPSEGVVNGALQVPPDGRPILLLAGHPVTGGYPVIAVVVSADLGRAAQLRPGQAIRFRLRG